jgi:La domain
VEFYFSDSNLPRDRFLREAVEESQDGCILNVQSKKPVPVHAALESTATV